MTYKEKRLVLIVMYLVTMGFGGARASEQGNLDEAWRLCFAVESSSGTDPAARVENYAHALGDVQITPIMVQDVNRILRAPVFCLSDRLNRAASREMFNVAQRHYNRGVSVEKMCRFWLRGPSRSRQYDEHGDEYWATCQRKGK